MAGARRLKVAQTPQQRETSGRAINKLARTFVAQVEAHDLDDIRVILHDQDSRCGHFVSGSIGNSM